MTKHDFWAICFVDCSAGLLKHLMDNNLSVEMFDGNTTSVANKNSVTINFSIYSKKEGHAGTILIRDTIRKYFDDNNYSYLFFVVTLSTSSAWCYENIKPQPI